jgi:hypothetical protein
MKRQKIKRQRKGLGAFKIVPDAQRLNPQTIRRMIHDIVVNEFENNLQLAAAELVKGRREYKNRNYKSGISGEGLYQLITDRHWIRYHQLEAFAIQRGVPISLLLFYTRLVADQGESEGRQKVQRLLRGFRRVLDDAQSKFRNGSPFGYADLVRWTENYKAHSQNEAVPGQLDLLDDEPAGA